ncbi:MAG: DUF4870 domain-containing protein [Phycicoccus sp.]
MNDSTPRPDQTPDDPTAPPPPPAEPVAALEVQATAPAPAPPSTPSPADPVPAADAAYPPPADPIPAAGTAYPPPAYPQQPPAQSYSQQPYAATPAPMGPTQERQWGMLAHIIGGVGLVTTAIGGFIGTLIVYVIYKDHGPFVRAHAANSLNVQITTFIGLVVGGITFIFVIGIFIIFGVIVWAVIVHVIGAVKANNGEWYDPPLAIKFVK